MGLLRSVLTAILEPKHLQLSPLFGLVDLCESLCNLGGSSGAAWAGRVPLNV
jgi:hypothetical protein